MINTELIEKLEQLPPSLQSQVEKMVDHLLEEKANNEVFESDKPGRGFGSGKGMFGKMPDDFDEPLDEKPKLKREFGGLKGFVTYVADDFDAPLEDFKEYR